MQTKMKLIITGLSLIIVGITLSINNASATTSKYDGTIGMVSIGLDHGFDSQWEPAQYMISKGIPATVYVVTNREQNPNFMSWTQLWSLNNNGFEMASHSRIHLIENKLSLPELYSEINGSKSDMTNQGMLICGFVPPSSEINKTTVQIINGNYQYTMMEYSIAKKQFKVGTLNTLSTISGSTKNIGQPILIALSVGNMQSNNQGYLQNFSSIKSQIDSAIKNKALLVIHFHDILPDNQTNFLGYQTPTSESLFNQTIDYISSLKDSGQIKVDTHSQALGLGC